MLVGKKVRLLFSIIRNVYRRVRRVYRLTNFWIGPWGGEWWVIELCVCVWLCALKWDRIYYVNAGRRKMVVNVRTEILYKKKIEFSMNFNFINGSWLSLIKTRKTNPLYQLSGSNDRIDTSKQTHVCTAHTHTHTDFRIKLASIEK